MDLKLLIPILLAFSGVASAESFHEVSVNSSAYEVESTVKTVCEEGPGDDGCPVSKWTLTLQKPEDSDLLSIRSSKGEVEEFDDYGDQVVVSTTHEDPVRSETVRMSYVVREDAEQVVEGLYTRSISLPAFSGDMNRGSLRVENLVSADVDTGANQSIEGESVNFSGSGPLRARLVFGNGESEGNYVFFPYARDGERAYGIATGTLGLPTRHSIPVGFMENEMYNRTLNRWSEGQFFRGSIVLRNRSSSSFTSILAHETVHAINEQWLDWSAGSSWFDEGVAKHVEYLARSSLEDPKSRTRKLFGDDTVYYERNGNRRYKYVLPSKGESDELWKYYQDNRSFMKDWNSDSLNRRFGYAYSELVIKNFVSSGGSIRELYSELRGSEVSSNAGKWQLLSGYMDLTPCRYGSRERFESCLERVNNHDYPVYSAEVSGGGSSLQVERLELPNRSGRDNSSVRAESAQGILSALVDWFNSFLGG